jgi:hypothetical protein
MQKTPLATLLIMGVIALALPISAQSQETPAPASVSGTSQILTKADHMRTLVKNCLATGVYADRKDAPLICACGAGYMAAALPERQYAMIALLSEAGLDGEKMSGIMRAMVSEGVASKDEVLEAATLMVTAGEQADKVCIFPKAEETSSFLDGSWKP